MPFRCVLLFLPGCLLAGASLHAQADDGDFLPGMLARYSAGGKTIQRFDPDVSFVWGAASPDTRLPAGPFAAD